MNKNNKKNMFLHTGLLSTIGSMITPAKITMGLLTGALALFAPLKISVICALTFIMVDFLLGFQVYRKCMKQQGAKVTIESNKLWKTVLKCRDAILLICGAFILDTHVIPSVNLHFVEFVAGVICGSEFVSWIENMATLRPNDPIFKILKRVIRNKSEKYLDTKLDDILTPDKKEVKDDKSNDNNNGN